MKNILKYYWTLFLFIPVCTACEEGERYGTTIESPPKLVYFDPSSEFMSATIMSTPLGVIYDEITIPVMINTTRHENTIVNIIVDNSLVAEYNEENETEYAVLPESYLVTTNLTGVVIPDGSLSPTTPVILAFQGDPSNLSSDVVYLIPLRLTSTSGISASEVYDLIYVMLTVSETSDMLRRSPSASSITGTLVEDRTGWSSSTGNDEMFDSNTDTYDASFTQSTAHTIDLGKEYNISVFRFYAYNSNSSYYRPTTYVIEYSSDNTNFSSLGSATSQFIYVGSSYQHIIPWISVAARYVRITATGGTSYYYRGMAEFDIYTK